MREKNSRKYTYISHYTKIQIIFLGITFSYNKKYGFLLMLYPVEDKQFIFEIYSLLAFCQCFIQSYEETVPGHENRRCFRVCYPREFES
jgi:hypothetical protein